MNLNSEEVQSIVRLFEILHEIKSRQEYNEEATHNQ